MASQINEQDHSPLDNYLPASFLTGIAENFQGAHAAIFGCLLQHLKEILPGLE